MFADDTKICNTSDWFNVIQPELTKLQEWTELWNLYFNVNKCKILHVGRNNPRHEYYMKVNKDTCRVDVCNEEKDLGITFDEKLSFDIHINSCINKANKMIGLIKRTFLFLDKDTFNRLYKALVRPHLEYGISIWSPYLKRQSIAVERVQRRATKILKECTCMPYGERLQYLNLHSLKGRRIRGDLILVFKIYNKLVDLDYSDLFKASIYDKTRGSEGKIYIQHCNTNTRKYSFTNRVAPLWNALPFALKNANTVNDLEIN